MTSDAPAISAKAIGAQIKDNLDFFKEQVASVIPIFYSTVTKTIKQAVREAKRVDYT